MSGGNIPPQPSPSPFGKYQGLITAIFAMLSMFLIGQQQKPAPLPPNDKPVVIDTKPVPIDKTTPPDVVPPQPVPGGPVPDIQVTDNVGKPVEEAGLNQQIIVSGAKAVRGTDPTSLILLVKPKVQQYQIGDVLVITTPDTYTLLEIQEIVALDGKIATKTITIQCGKPEPTPLPAPQPAPSPVQKGKVVVVTVENPKNRTEQVAMFLEGMRTWDAFIAAGNDWYNYDAEDGTPAGRAASSALLTANVIPPAVIIKDKSTGVILYTGKMPDDAMRTALIKQYTGDL